MNVRVHSYTLPYFHEELFTINRVFVITLPYNKKKQ